VTGNQQTRRCINKYFIYSGLYKQCK